MQNLYNGKPLSEVPYDAIEVGMKVVGARGTPGKIAHKSLLTFSDDPWIRIDWENHPQQAKNQSQFTDVILKVQAEEPVLCNYRVTFKAKNFTFEPIARGAVMHLALFYPTTTTRNALDGLSVGDTISPLSLWQKEESTDGDEIHVGPYEFITAFADSKNGEAILHVLLKDPALFRALEE
jgi:hypothetical protein